MIIVGVHDFISRVKMGFALLLKYFVSDIYLFEWISNKYL